MATQKNQSAELERKSAFCGFVRISVNSEERQAYAAAKDEITI